MNTSWISVIVTNVCEDAAIEKIIPISDEDRLDTHPLKNYEETNTHVHQLINVFG